MKKYHKIRTALKRDPDTHQLIDGVYSLPIFEFLENCEWSFTEKIDGTNIRILWDGNSIAFGGRTDRAMLPKPLFLRLEELFPSAAVFENIFGTDGGICLYGEGYGAGIQKGGGNYNPDGCDFILFDVKVGEWWLERENIEGIAQSLGIDVVPSLAEEH